MRGLFGHIVSVFFAVLAAVSVQARDSSQSVMTLSMENGRIMARIPSSTLGRRVLMASIIEQTSDSGEGLAGQMSDNCVSVIFSVSGTSLVVSVPYGSPVTNVSGDAAIDDALSDVSVAGEWKRYDVKSRTAEGDVVVDLTDFFQTHFSLLYTFPADAYNAMGGQVRREYRMVKESSRFVGVENADGMSSVLCDFQYDMDGYVMGVMKIAGEYSLRALVRKILFFPREQDRLMAEVVADPAIPVASVERRQVEDVLQPVVTEAVVRRWRVEPSDSAAWNAGGIVRPKKQIVFQVDTLMPESWKPYVKEGVLEWNEAFRAAGFEDVLRVEDLVSDSLSTAWSPFVSRVIFAPSGMQEVVATSMCDDDDHEIFSANICFHSSALHRCREDLMREVSVICPGIRGGEVSDSLSGGLVKLLTMRAVGKALGLKDGSMALSAYPADSLRSAGFTGAYGITPSVMEPVVFNYLAREEDVAAGTALFSSVTGPADRDAIAWMYGPEALRGELSAKAAGEELPLRADLGDDPFGALDVWVSSQKSLLENLSLYFGGCSKEEMASVVTSVADQYARRIVQVARYVGRYPLKKGGRNVCLPRSVQSEAVKTVFARLRDMEWLRSIPGVELPYGTNEYIGDVYRTNIFRTLLKRADRLGEDYSEQEFYGDVYDELFSMRRLCDVGLPTEQVWREMFVSFLSERVSSSPEAYAMLEKTGSALKRTVAEVPQESKGHCRYLIFLIDRILNYE